MPATAGQTLGVEEEFHLVDAETLRLAACPELAQRAARHQLGRHLHAEMVTSQFEASTEVCTDLGQLRRALGSGRREAAAAAADAGTRLLATSTHPLAARSEIDILALPRYAQLQHRFGSVIGELNLTGCHVHVGVPDPDVAVLIMSHARPYLPVLAALTASSPFLEGRDTGYDSVRLAWLGLWPQGGPPPLLHSAKEYQATVDRLIAVGLIDEPTALLWEVRPSARFPTLEFRIGDAGTDVDDVLLHAALVRSLVRTLAARVDRGEAPPSLPDSVLRAARWRAARYGLSGRLWSPSRGMLLPGPAVVAELLAELRADLHEHGEAGPVEQLWNQLRSRGTSAARQRRMFTATGSMPAVLRWGLQVTAGG